LRFPLHGRGSEDQLPVRANYVDEIFNGAEPKTLPGRPTDRVEIVVNSQKRSALSPTKSSARGHALLAPRTMTGLLDIAAIPSDSIRTMARLSHYDWFSVTRAGEDEAVAQIVRGFVADEGG
jgi:hypothetical protein